MSTTASAQAPLTIRDFEDNLPVITERLIADIKAGDYTNKVDESNVPSKSSIQLAMEEIRDSSMCAHCGHSAPSSDNILEAAHQKLIENLRQTVDGLEKKIEEMEQPLPVNNDVIYLDENAIRIIREAQDQIKFYEGKLRAVIEYACMNNPGLWSLSEGGNALIRTEG